MIVKILEKINEQKLPFEWLDLEYLPNSFCMRKEIYLKDKTNLLENLAMLFYALFRKFRDQFIIANGQWGDFCLDTWYPNTNEYNYELEGKSQETKDYLKLLIDSKIEVNYSGLCICKNWDSFLSATLLCIINHKAPFSPLFFNLEEEFVFYFHHTGSIGLLYKAENETVKEILSNARRNSYLVKDTDNG